MPRRPHSARIYSVARMSACFVSASVLMLIGCRSTQHFHYSASCLHYVGYEEKTVGCVRPTDCSSRPVARWQVGARSVFSFFFCNLLTRSLDLRIRAHMLISLLQVVVFVLTRVVTILVRPLINCLLQVPLRKCCEGSDDSVLVRDVFLTESEQS